MLTSVLGQPMSAQPQGEVGADIEKCAGAHLYATSVILLEDPGRDLSSADI
ncbi:MAG: hypothetical protein ACYCYK_08240 [Candidatus Dormibacteria bacterium]